MHLWSLFAQAHANDAAKLRPALTVNQFIKAVLLAGIIKSIATVLGVEPLRCAAFALERAIEAGLPNSQLATQVDTIEAWLLY